MRRQRTRQLGTVLPPLDIFWTYRRRPATDANLIKAARAAIVWRGADRWDAARIVARYLRWTRFPWLLLRSLIADGLATRKGYGRSVRGQITDMARIAFANGLTPGNYYQAALARYKGAPELFNYLPFDLVRPVSRYVSRDGLLHWSEGTSSKLFFEHICRAADIRVVRTIAVVGASRTRAPDGGPFVGLLPDCDIVLKPLIGERGQGVELFRSKGRHQFTDSRGDVRCSQGLVAYAREAAKTSNCAILLQARVRNHPDLRPLAGSALATLRIVTMPDESGLPEIVEAFYRTSVVAGAAADNFHAGGLIFPVDIDTGALAPGFSYGRFGAAAPVTHHPFTGAPVAGVIHPGWTESANLALRLHRLFPNILRPGWDIGFDESGVIAVEGNDASSVSIARQAYFDGIGGTRTLALLAHHAGQWLERNEPEQSRWRFSRDAPKVS